MTNKLLIALLLAAGATGAARADQVRTITCESNNEERHYCPLPEHVHEVAMTRQLSKNDCRRGETWEVEKKSGLDKLWVRRGCRAEFAVHFGDTGNGTYNNRHH